MKANHPTGIDPRLSQVLQGQEDNYLLPFYWQHGNHYDRIPAQIQRIRNSGCRAICLESRPHPDFCGPGWWRDVDLILEECRKRDMQVWILDDKHFPTGYVNGQVPTKYPHLRPWNLVERHVDVIGPLSHASLLMTPGSEEEPLVGVYAYRRSGEDENLTGSPVDLTAGVRNGFLYLDIPEGCWRVFFLYRSHRGGHRDYIDMIAEGAGAALLEKNREAVDALTSATRWPGSSRTSRSSATAMWDSAGWTRGCMRCASARTAWLCLTATACWP